MKKKTHIQKKKKKARLRVSVFDLACEKLSWVFLAWMLIVRGLGDIHIHADNLNGTCTGIPQHCIIFCERRGSDTSALSLLLDFSGNFLKNRQ